MSDASGTITRIYDALNRVVSKTVPTFGATTFAYDITAGLAAGYTGESTTISGRTMLKVYDKAGRLAEVRDGNQAASTYAYYPNGSLQTQVMPGNITASYTYYANGKLQTLQNKQGGLTLEAYQYAYDGAGNMTAKQDVKGTTAYTYTLTNQLATVNEPSGKQTAYTYDSAGNRQSETVMEGSAAVTTQYEVNEQNRLLSTEKAFTAKTVIEQYFYDDAGNLTGRLPEAYVDEDANAVAGIGVAQAGQEEDEELIPAVYVYDDKSQMVEATNGGETVSNVYNAEGLRIAKTVDGVTTQYCYEYSKVIKEVDSEGSVAYNVYGMNLISRDLDGTKVYYLYNGHGDVTALVNTSGVIIASYYYDAFGVVVEANASSSFGNPYRYAGYVYDDEVRLYYLNARFYDAKIARFMQEDTYLGNRSDPLSLNLYAYCRNNPLMYWDPSGHNIAYHDTYQQHLIDIGQTSKDSMGTTIFPDYNYDDAYNYYHNDYVNSQGGTYGWSDSDYYNYATQLGMNTGPESSYKTTLDILFDNRGNESLSSASFFNGTEQYNYNPAMGLTLAPGGPQNSISPQASAAGTASLRGLNTGNTAALSLFKSQFDTSYSGGVSVEVGLRAYAEMMYKGSVINWDPVTGTVTVNYNLMTLSVQSTIDNNKNGTIYVKDSLFIDTFGVGNQRFAVYQNGNNYSIQANFNISGGAINDTIGSMTYSEAFLQGIANDWSNNNVFSNYKVAVYTRQNLVGFTTTINHPGNVNDASNANIGSPITMFTGDGRNGGSAANHRYSADDFMSTSAHEFGHAGFHVMDIYLYPDPNPNNQGQMLKSDTGISNPFPSIMNNQFGLGGAREVDYAIVLEHQTWQSNNWFYYSSEPDTLNANLFDANKNWR